MVDLSATFIEYVERGGKAVLITHSSGMTQALRRADCRDRNR